MTDRPILVVALASSEDPTSWIDALNDRLPGLEVQGLDAVRNPDRVRYVAAWQHRPGALSGFPGLRAIFSLGAGVDHLTADPDLPADVPIVRVVDADLTARMSEWVVLHVLLHHRQFHLYAFQQAEKIWADDGAQPAARDVRVGVMGLGVLGRDAAGKLAMLGFDVAGWSRTPKILDGLTTFAGGSELDAFLARTRILVCLLPLTPDTRGILDGKLFARLARDSHVGGPVLINAGRGSLQNERDILAALEEGTLRAATLDVFEREPLPSDSPLWHHPAVTITPHNAALSSPAATSAFIAGEIAVLEAGGASTHSVDRAKFY